MRVRQSSVMIAGLAAGALVFGSGALSATAAASTQGFGPAAASSVAPAALDVADLESRVTVAGITAHLEALQRIADENGGNRAIGTPGYEQSAAYIEGVLAAAGYETTRQPFETTTQKILDYSLTVGAAAPIGLVGIPMEFTPSTPAAGLVDLPVVVPGVATGCTAEDWAGIDATGSIALVSRGVCSFVEKSLAAAAAGAEAVLVYNNTEGDLNGTLGEQLADTVPSVGLTTAEGEAILDAVTSAPAGEPVTASLQLQQQIETIETFNVLAETPAGDDTNTVMVGAHLDSVPEGPGINDNGSGSATILETAVQLAASGTPNNQVRFAWWGAEEVGLVGSTFYVDDLAENNPAELDEIATYLNFDMVASPNYVISVYDADQSTYEAPVEVPEGSIATEKAFTDYFDAADQPWIDTAFDGRSDYQQFIAYGVPASGLFTGADDIKTADEADLFGGVVGEQHDQNYHQPGDNIANINAEALGIMSGAIANVVGSLANDTSAINGVVPPVTPVPTPVPTESPEPTPAPTGSPVPSPTQTAVPVPVPVGGSGGSGSGSGAPGGSGGDPDALASTGVADALGIALPAGALLFGAGLTIALLQRRASRADARSNRP